MCSEQAYFAGADSYSVGDRQNRWITPHHPIDGIFFILEPASDADVNLLNDGVVLFDAGWRE